MVPPDRVMYYKGEIGLHALEEIECKSSDLVKRTTAIDGGALHAGVNHLGQGDGEISAEDLGAEEDLRAQESLVTDIDRVRGLGLLDHALELAEAVLGVSVVLLVLFDQIRAHIAVGLLDLLGHLDGGLGGEFLTSITKNLDHEVGDISSGKGNVFDTAANYVTFELKKHIKIKLPQGNIPLG